MFEVKKQNRLCPAFPPGRPAPQVAKSTVSMSDAEDEEEDPRIAQLYNFASKRYDDDGKYTGEPQEIVDYVAKLGTDKAIVHGSMMLNPAVARAYFIVMALVDADGEDEPTITECITLRRTALKALVADGGADAAQMLLAALESYVARMQETKDSEVSCPARCPARYPARCQARSQTNIHALHSPHLGIRYLVCGAQPAVHHAGRRV